MGVENERVWGKILLLMYAYKKQHKIIFSIIKVNTIEQTFELKNKDRVWGELYGNVYALK